MVTGSPVAIVAVDGSPTGGGRTAAALSAVLAAAASTGASTSTVAFADEPATGVERALEAIPAADGFVLGSPVYRGSFATPLKSLLDAIPRSNDAELESPLCGKSVAIVLTGASLHHFLALDHLRDVLAGFFAAYVLPPGLYVPREGFGEELSLLDPYADQARLQGLALVELVAALRRSRSLRALRPQA
jgi:FMN reductase